MLPLLQNQPRNMAAYRTEGSQAHLSHLLEILEEDEKLVRSSAPAFMEINFTS